MNLHLSNGLSRMHTEAELLHKIHSCCFGTLFFFFFFILAYSDLSVAIAQLHTIRYTGRNRILKHLVVH
jgi:hypothetical protein